MTREKIFKEIESLLFTESEFGALFDIQIDYNRLVFEGKVFKDLIATENKLKWEDES